MSTPRLQKFGFQIWNSLTRTTPLWILLPTNKHRCILMVLFFGRELVVSMPCVLLVGSRSIPLTKMSAPSTFRDGPAVVSLLITCLWILLWWWRGLKVEQPPTPIRNTGWFQRRLEPLLRITFIHVAPMNPGRR